MAWMGNGEVMPCWPNVSMSAAGIPRPAKVASLTAAGFAAREGTEVAADLTPLLVRWRGRDDFGVVDCGVEVLVVLMLCLSQR